MAIIGARISLLAFGIVLLLLNQKTIREVVKYYTKPKENTLTSPFKKINWDNSIGVLLVSWGFSISIVAILPFTDNFADVNVLKEVTPLLTLIMILYRVLFEEVLFRLIPWGWMYWLRSMDKTGVMQYVNIFVALLAALIFGLLHIGNYTNPTLTNWLSLSSQVVGGLLLWYLTEKEGILAAISIHYVFNMVVLWQFLF